MGCLDCPNRLWMLNWKFLLTLSIPFIFFFVIFIPGRDYCTKINEKFSSIIGRQFSYIYVAILMIVQYLMCFPDMGVIGFMPIAILPLLSIDTSKKISTYYMQDNNMTFLATSTIGIALGCTQLQRRFVILIMALNGVNLVSITLTIMWTTAVLSAFFTSSAAVMIMIPVAMLVKNEIHQILLDDNLANEGTSVPRKVYFKRKFTAEEVTGTDVNGQTGETNEPTVDMVEVDNDPEENSRQKAEETGTVIRAEEPRKNTKGSGSEKGGMMDEESVAAYMKNKSSIVALQEFEKVFEESKNELHPEDEKALKKFEESLLLTIAAGANIGGIFFPYSTLASDPVYYPRKECKDCGKVLQQVSLQQWFVYSFPVFIILMVLISRLRVLMTFSLQSRWKFSFRKCGLREKEATDDQPKGIVVANDPHIQQKVKDIMKEKYRELGPFLFRESAVGIVLIVCSILYFFRDPRFLHGWAHDLTKGEDAGKIRIAGIATLFIILLFLLPRSIRESICSDKSDVCEPLIQWKLIQKRVAWGLVLMIGGSTIMLVYAEKTRLNDLIAIKLTILFQKLPKEIILILFLIISSILSQLIGNVAIIGIMTPILTKASCKWGILPIYFVMPITLSCILSFVFPISSIPNAILFTTNLVSWKRMMKAGWLSNVIAITIVYLNHLTIANFVFKFKDYDNSGDNLLRCELLDDAFKTRIGEGENATCIRHNNF